MESTFKSGLKSEGFWVRIMFMAAYFIVFRLLDLLVILVSLAQCLFTLITGKPNSALAQFASGLAVFSKQIIDYLGFSSDQKPFPFQDWAGSQSVTDADLDDQKNSPSFQQSEPLLDQNENVTDSTSSATSSDSESSSLQTQVNTKDSRV